MIYKNQNKKEIFLINPRGYCSGVKRAIATVDHALKIYSRPIYVFHDIVHNERVVNNFKKQGVIFKNNLKSIPDHSVLIFSAHGVSPKIRNEAEVKKMIVIDATCPLVCKIHNEAIKFSRENYKIILIGRKRHHEVTGIMGEVPMALVSCPEDVNRLNFGVNEKIACLTQSTFLKSDRDKIFKLLKLKYKNLIRPLTDDICPATCLRRDAIKKIAKKINLLLVVGSEKSNNARRLVDAAKQSGIKSYLLSSCKKINEAILKNCQIIAVTAAASTSEEEVTAVIKKIRNLFTGIKISEIGAKTAEPIFTLPL